MPASIALGLVGALLRRVGPRRRLGGLAGALAGALALGLALAVVRSGSVLASTETGVLPAAAPIAALVAARADRRDRLLSSVPSIDPLIYYLNRQQGSAELVYNDVGAGPHVFIVVNEDWGQDLGQVLRYWSVDYDWLRSARLLERFPGASVYQADTPGRR